MGHIGYETGFQNINNKIFLHLELKKYIALECHDVMISGRFLQRLLIRKV